eukprot:162965-Prymnesium_polylepis.1
MSPHPGSRERTHTHRAHKQRHNPAPHFELLATRPPQLNRTAPRSERSLPEPPLLRAKAARAQAAAAAATARCSAPQPALRTANSHADAIAPCTARTGGLARAGTPVRRRTPREPQPFALARAMHRLDRLCTRSLLLLPTLALLALFALLPASHRRLA